MSISVALRTTHSYFMSPKSLTLSEHVETYLQQFLDTMTLLRETCSAHRRDTVSADEVLTSVSFPDDNLGVDVQFRTSSRLYNKHSQAICIDTQPLYQSISLPLDMKKTSGVLNIHMPMLISHVVGASPHQPLLLQFDGNLSTVPMDIISTHLPYTVILRLGQARDIQSLIWILPELPSPVLPHLALIEITVNLARPQETLQKLARAFEDACLAREPSLWERLVLYWHPRPGEVFVYDQQTRALRRVNEASPGLGATCKPVLSL